MTVLVTVQASGDMTRLRRYEARTSRRLRCTHAGLYDPESVDQLGVLAYVNTGALQDRCCPGRCDELAGRRPA